MSRFKGASAALAAFMQSSCPEYPPHGNTGGKKRQNPSNKKEKPKGKGRFAKVKSQNARRKSRAKSTSPEMQKVLDSAVYDWLTVTSPNSITGTGERLGTFPVDPGTMTEFELFEKGQAEEHTARQMFLLWAASRGLRAIRVGKGTDQYHGAAHFAYDPTSKDRMASIRAGHSTNMPSMELPGADGECAKLALAALSELGPLNVARVDVSIDCSMPGLWEALVELGWQIVKRRGNMNELSFKGAEETGRSFSMGSDELNLTVYEKSYERYARKKISLEELDPHLVRVEFSIQPHKAPDKARYGFLMQSKNPDGTLATAPGDLLKTSYWVREFVQGFAKLAFAVSAEDAILGVTRLPQRPGARSCYVKTKRVVRQFSRTFCNAAIAQIVDQEWQGDWAAALVDPALVVDRVIEMIRPEIEARAFEMCQFHGTFEAQTLEEEAHRANSMLADWMERQLELERKAIRGLREAAHEVAKEFRLSDENSEADPTAE
ncbi:MAG: hypothetical protein ACPGNV_08560 [Mangrovicoccus sp.]